MSQVNIAKQYDSNKGTYYEWLHPSALLSYYTSFVLHPNNLLIYIIDSTFTFVSKCNSSFTHHEVFVNKVTPLR
jgi:hypothetical protein